MFLLPWPSLSPVELSCDILSSHLQDVSTLDPARIHAADFTTDSPAYQAHQLFPPNMADQKIEDAHSVLFDQGLKMRYQVAGKEYVDKALQNGSSEFARPMQEVSKSREERGDEVL